MDAFLTGGLVEAGAGSQEVQEVPVPAGRLRVKVRGPGKLRIKIRRG